MTRVESPIIGAVVPHDTELPPPRPGVRYVPVSFLGIVIADDELRDRVERWFHLPMLVLAFLILPLLVLEFAYFNRQHADPNYSPGDDWLYWLTHFGFAVIWLAFVAEFLVKVWIAECRLEYARRNWLDMVIIAMPLLRPLRAAMIAKTSRVFTLRGVGMKALKAVVTLIIGLEATERLLERLGLKSTSGRTPTRTMTRQQLADEVTHLRRQCDEWESWWEAHTRFIERQGYDRYSEPRPDPYGESEPPQDDDQPRRTQ